MILDPIREIIRRMAGTPRTTGLPTSSNRASSFHLLWELPDTEPVVEAAATLEVVAPPTVDRLYFWALQASFAGADGRRYGGAHLGLQWHVGHPGNTAANWGGYRPEGGELDGSESPQPSARDNPNTRDFTWEPGRPYRLSIRRVRGGEWGGFIDGVELRRLYAGGDRLADLMVWSEVFAACDDPTAVVRWSELEAFTSDGWGVNPTAVRVNYQSRMAGGCDNTTVRADGNGFLQITNAARAVRQGTRFPVDENFSR